MTESPERRHHLVADVEDAVRVAKLEAPAVVPRGRHDHPARALDRLADEAGHALRPDALDGAAHFGDQDITELFLAHATPVAVGIGRLQVVHETLLAQPAIAVAGIAQARREVSAAMISVMTREDMRALRLPETMPVVVHQANRRVRSGGPTSAEDHAVQITRRKGRELRAQIGHHRVAEVVEGRVVVEFAHLLGDSIGHLLAPVTDVAAPHAAQPVQKAPAALVEDVVALGTGDHGTLALRHVMQVRKGVHEVAAVTCFRKAWHARAAGGGIHGASPADRGISRPPCSPRQAGPSLP